MPQNNRKWMKSNQLTILSAEGSVSQRHGLCDGLEPHLNSSEPETLREQLQPGSACVASGRLTKGRARHRGAALPECCQRAGAPWGGKRSGMGLYGWTGGNRLCRARDRTLPPHWVGRLKEGPCVRTDPQTAAHNV